MVTDKRDNTIAILGAGNMGRAIADGLLQKGVVSRDTLILTNTVLNELRDYERKGIEVTSDNKLATRQAKILIIAVKPKVVASVLTEISPEVTADTLVISIAAGVTLHAMETFLPENTKIVRAMPNLAAQVGQSVSAWVSGSQVTAEEEATVHTILSGIGMSVKVQNEDMINSVTAVAGSGPAYVFYLAEVMIEAAKQLGLSTEIAEGIVHQTIVGSGALMQANKIHPQDLRSMVTSPGGTTEAAFSVIENSPIKQSFIEALTKAYDRSCELAK